MRADVTTITTTTCRAVALCLAAVWMLSGQLAAQGSADVPPYRVAKHDPQNPTANSPTNAPQSTPTNGGASLGNLGGGGGSPPSGGFVMSTSGGPNGHRLPHRGGLGTGSGSGTGIAIPDGVSGRFAIAVVDDDGAPLHLLFVGVKETGSELVVDVGEQLPAHVLDRIWLFTPEGGVPVGVPVPSASAP